MGTQVINGQEKEEENPAKRVGKKKKNHTKKLPLHVLLSPTFTVYSRHK